LELKDNQVKTIDELIEAFKEKWRDKEPTNLKVAHEMVVKVDKNMQEPEFHREQEKEFHLEDPKKPINEFVYHMDGVNYGPH
jgi:FMN-dependent NADH-azoreductase